jgi:hypothetical protein
MDSVGRHNYGVELISNITGQQYHWSCSTVNPSTNLTSLPDLPVKDHATLISQRPSNFIVPVASDLTIYPLPDNLDCGGTVLAVDFCHSENDVNLFDIEAQVFTLLILSRNGSSFTVNNTFAINSISSPDTCGTYEYMYPYPDITIQYCCDRFWLDSQDWFTLPASNFAFGVTTYPSTSRNLLAYSRREFPSLVADQYTFNINEEEEIPTTGSNFMLSNEDTLSKRSLRMMNFVFGKSILSYINVS